MFSTSVPDCKNQESTDSNHTREAKSMGSAVVESKESKPNSLAWSTNNLVSSADRKRNVKCFLLDDNHSN